MGFVKELGGSTVESNVFRWRILCRKTAYGVLDSAVEEVGVAASLRYRTTDEGCAINGRGIIEERSSDVSGVHFSIRVIFRDLERSFKNLLGFAGEFQVGDWCVLLDADSTSQHGFKVQTRNFAFKFEIEDDLGSIKSRAIPLELTNQYSHFPGADHPRGK
jgi:hypothetical protein